GRVSPQGSRFGRGAGMVALRIRSAIVACVLALAAGCARVTPPRAPARTTGAADFSRYVAVGNSLTAGYRSGGLLDIFEDEAYPVLVARQAGLPPLRHPRVAAPGYPPVLELDF